MQPLLEVHSMAVSPLYCEGFDPFTAAEFANSVALYKAIKGGGIDSLPTAADLKV